MGVRPTCQFCNEAVHALTADDANLLDGLDSTQFLRSDTSGTLNGNLTINGNTTLGTAGTPIISHLSITRSISFSNPIPGHQRVDVVFAVPGVAPGDNISIFATPLGDIGIPFVWCTFVANNNFVAIRIANYTPNTATPATSNWRVDVWKH